MEWHYIVDSERKGPATEETIGQLLTAGVIDRDTRVWNASLPDWQPLSTSALAHLLPSSNLPPVPSAFVGNSPVWTLAFCPIFGGILTILLAPMVDTAGGLFWLAPLLNVFLSYADEKKLSKAGYPTKLLGGAWLIPAYLWKRASLLKQSKAYFWVWCSSLIIALLFL